MTCWCPKVGDRVRVMDPWRGVVECFRATVLKHDWAWATMTVRPDFNPGERIRIDHEAIHAGTVKPLDDNRVCRWRAA